nr:LuxR C-terminal-related transcriptional regulator [Paenibacillus typhae]
MKRVIAARVQEKRGALAPNEASSLTEKETLILQAVAQGYKSKAIASDMSISERTVKAHLTTILKNLEWNHGLRRCCCIGERHS